MKKTNTPHFQFVWWGWHDCAFFFDDGQRFARGTIYRWMLGCGPFEIRRWLR